MEILSSACSVGSSARLGGHLPQPHTPRARGKMVPLDAYSSQHALLQGRPLEGPGTTIPSMQRPTPLFAAVFCSGAESSSGTAGA